MSKLTVWKPSEITVTVSEAEKYSAGYASYDSVEETFVLQSGQYVYVPLEKNSHNNVNVKLTSGWLRKMADIADKLTEEFKEQREVNDE